MKRFKIYYQVIQDTPEGVKEIEAETEEQAHKAFDKIADDDPVQLLLDANVSDPNWLKVKVDEIKEVK